MSDSFKFELQRFGDVVFTSTGGEEITLTAVVPANESKIADGAYYWDSANDSIISTFEGTITITADFDEAYIEEDEDTKTYYVISGISEIILPDNAGAGEIKAGANVDSPIQNLGSATITLGDITLGFTNADSEAAIQITGGNTVSISQVNLNSGSFEVTAESGITDLYVNGYSSSDIISINKPFTYNADVTIGSGFDAKTISTIEITETGASIGSADGASRLIVPAIDKITVHGAELEYSLSSANATIDVEQDGEAGIFVAGNGDKVIVTKDLAKYAGTYFHIYEGSSENDEVEIGIDVLPKDSGYTFTRVDNSVYTATDLNSSLSLQSGNYLVDNTSGNVEILLGINDNNDTRITGIILDTGDKIFGGSGLDNIGDEVTIYGGSTDNPAQLAIDDIGYSPSGFSLTRQEDGFELSGIASGVTVILNDYTTEDSKTALKFSYTGSQGGWITYSDEGEIAASLGSGKRANIQGELTVTDYNQDSVQEFTLNGTTFNVDNLNNSYTITNLKNQLSISGLVNGAAVTAEGIVSVTTDEYDAKLTINGEEYTTTDNYYEDHVVVFNSDGTVDFSATTGFKIAGGIGIQLVAGVSLHSSSDGETLVLEDNRTDSSPAELELDFNTKSANDYGISDDYKNLDLSNAKGKFNVIGSSHNFDSIKGSNFGGTLTANGSSLEGGDGDDELIGESSYTDIFVQTGGNDTIKNYDDWRDMIKISSSITSESVDAENNTVQFDFADGSKIILTDIIGERITFFTDDSDDAFSYDIAALYGDDSDDGGSDYGDSDDGDSDDDSSDDEIYNSNSDVTVEGTAEDDKIYNSGSNVTINAGAGDDNIRNGSINQNILINAGDGNDTIDNSGILENITVRGGKGDDSINNSGIVSNVLIQYSAGDGDDYISGFDSSSTLQILSGTVKNISRDDEENIVLVEIGENTITLDTDYSTDAPNIIDANGNPIAITVSGTAQDDEIYNEFNGAVVAAGAGNDYISNNGQNVTISAGAGDDYINNYNSGANVLIQYTGGNDTIHGLNTTSTLKIGDGTGTYSTQASGADVLVNVAKNTITLKDALTELDAININNDNIALTKNISLTENDDSAYINRSGVVVNAGGGNDSIHNYGATVSIFGGDGDDTIANSGSKVSISGGDGNDIIRNSGANVLIQYTGGNDTIHGLNTTSTLKIGDGTGTFSTQTSGANLLIGVGNNTITLEDALTGTESVRINNEVIALENKVIMLTDEDDEVEINRNSISINGGAGDDDIDSYGDNVTIDGGEGDDYISNEGTKALIQYTGGDDYIICRDENSTVQIMTGKVDSVGAEYDSLFIVVGNNTVTVVTDGVTPNILNADGSQVEFKISGTDDEDDISNQFSNTTVETGEGDDYISNDGDNVTIDAGAGNDQIDNYGSNVSINAGAGDDYIDNSGDNVTISTGAGDDSIDNDGANVLIQYSVGNDFISGFNSNSTLQLTTGKFSNVELEDRNVLLTVGKSTVTLGVNGKNAKDLNVFNADGSRVEFKISGTNSADDITNLFNNVTIDTGADDDYISNYGSNVSINAGKDDDNISNSGDNVTISAGVGDDNINNSGANVLIQYTGGNDYINGFSENSTLQIMTGTVSSVSAEYGDVFIVVGEDTLTLDGAYALDLNIVDANKNPISLGLDVSGEEINLSDGDDDYSILNAFLNTLRGYGGNDTLAIYGGKKNYIDAGAGNDIVYNTSTYTKIYGGAGDDSIDNNADNVFIDMGAGNDTINDSNYTNNITIDAGAGDDYLSFSGRIDNASINSGAGDDFISFSNGDNVSINGGAGNNTIQINDDQAFIDVSEGNNTIYTSWRGDITVNGFGVGDAIVLNEEISELNEISGVGVVAGDVTIKGLSGVGAPSWSFKGNVATYSENANAALNLADDRRTIVYGTGRNTGSGNVLVTVSGVASADGLAVDTASKVVTVYANSLGRETITVSDGYTLALGDDVPSLTSSSQEGWRFSDNTATYIEGSVTEGYTLKDNQITYTSTSGDGALTVTVTGVTSASGLSIDTENKIVTVSASSLSHDLRVSVSGNYTLALGEDASGTTGVKETTWQFDGNKASYVSGTKNSGYVVENNRIVYKSETDGETLVTVEGVISTEGLAVDTASKVVTVNAASLGKETVKVSEGYILALGDDVSKITEEQTSGWIMSGSVATYMDGTTRVGYEIQDNEIIYTASGEDGALVRVEGVKATTGLSLSGNVVTVSASSLSQNSTVKVSEGYTLQLGSDVPTFTKQSTAGWKISEGKATYTITTVATGYVVRDNEIVYKSTSTDEDLFTIEGVNSTDALGIDTENKIVTVPASALSQNSTVKISDGYKLALGDGITTAQIGNTEWSMGRSYAQGKISYGTAGYKLENNQISYVSDNSTSTVALFNVVSVDGLKLNGNVVTVSKEALDGVENIVRVSEGYQLELDSEVKTPQFVGGAVGSFIYDNVDNSVIYSSPARTEGYRIVDNAIAYTAAKSGEDVTIRGLMGKNGIKINGDTFIIPAALLQEKTVRIVDVEGYNLALADDVEKSSRKPRGWEFKEGAGIYTTGSTTAGYKVTNNVITFDEAEVAETLLAVEGVTSEDGLYIDTQNKILTVYGEALKGDDITITEGDYSLELADAEEYAPSDKGGWDVQSQRATYRESAGSAGYVLSNDKKSIIYRPETVGAIKAELEGVNAKPTFKVVDGEQTNIIQLTDENFADDEISVLSNTGKYQFELSGEFPDMKFIGTAEEETVTNSGEEFILDLGDGNDSIVNSGNRVSISGGAGNDKINNSGEGVSVIGGAGNDVVSLSSGTGHNVFVYKNGDGKDRIFNFGKNDTIKIEDAANVETELSGKDVIFKVGNGKIAVKKAMELNSALNVVDSANKAIEGISGRTYTESGVVSTVDGGEQKIILAPDLESYTAEVAVVDASQLESGVSIDGGEQGSTLTGGMGKDYLISGSQQFELEGGTGNDVFVYNGKASGRIKDYNVGGRLGKDKILLDGVEIKKYDTSANALVLTFDDEHTLTIDAGTGLEINFGDKSLTFNDDGVFSAKGKRVSLGGNSESDKNKNAFTATKNYSKVATIDGSAADYEISLTGNKKANSIVAGSDGATLDGDKGKDTLVGGDGADVFIYKEGGGNKLIQNYEFSEVGGDVISLVGGTQIEAVEDKGDDLILSVGNNKITIEGGAGKAFKFSDGTEKISENGLLMNAAKTSVSLTAEHTGTSFDIGSDEHWVNFDASARKKGATIAGDTEANSIIGSKGADSINGGDGDDSLRGGKGNDTLWGGDGADTFIFSAGDGTDVIKDFDASMDKILIYSKRSDSRFSDFKGKYSSKNGGTITLAVSGGGKINIEGVGDNLTSETTFNINGTDYHLSGKKLK